MKKIVILTITLLVVLFFSMNLLAFCVYNFSDRVVRVEQMSNFRFVETSFTKTIKPGEKACCNWKNHDCNKEGKRDSSTKFYIVFEGKSYDLYSCNITIKAGGYIILKGKNGNYSCEAHGY